MAYKKQRVLQSIADNLSFNSGSIALENAIGLFDSNRGAQDFFAKLLSLVCGYNDLKDLDKLNGIVNYPAIDLGDKAARVAFQITTENTSDKIKDTIRLFNENHLADDYDRLIVFIIGKKRNYTTTFSTDSKFTFDPENDIWDDEIFVKHINKIENDSVIREVESFLNDNLLEYKYPEHLFPQDIKNCIQYIKTGIDDMLLMALKDVRPTPTRDPDTFIPQKNELNSVSLDFFKNNIQGHLPYGPLIKRFISDPINKDSLNDYMLITQSIQDFYETHRSEFNSFESVFTNIFNRLKPDYSSDTSLDKVRVLLHNMYFNCDIGDNPDDQA